MKKYLLPIVILLVSAFSACTYVVAPQDLPPPAPVAPTVDSTRKVAVIETWMGHSCGLCVRTDSMIEDLEAIYDSSLITIAIHDGFFALPASISGNYSCAVGNPNAFNEDFRCATGADYTAHFPYGSYSLVRGMINRRSVTMPNEFFVPSDWQAHIDTVTAQSAPATLHMNHTYNSVSRAVMVNISGTWLQAYSGNINVVVLLTEDSLLGWQDGVICDSQYVFNHVLRECLNTPGSITGSQISTGTTTIGTTYTYSLSAPYTLPTNFNAAHCTLVGMIYDTATMEILQAWKQRI